MYPSDKARVLVADSEASARDRVRESLAVSPIELMEAASLGEAMKILSANELDLVITELRLPEASGYALCRHLRERSDPKYLPVIVMSTWTTESDRILAFECGADDFVAKPFFARELSSRVEAVLRRRRDEPTAEQAAAESPGLATPEAAATSGTRRPREVLLDGRSLSLTPKERALLGALASAEGRVLSRNALIEQIWGDRTALTSRSIDSHIKSLRRKLAPASDCVETVRGVGYRFAMHPGLEFR